MAGNDLKSQINAANTKNPIKKIKTIPKQVSNTLLLKWFGRKTIKLYSFQWFMCFLAGKSHVKTRILF